MPPKPPPPASRPPVCPAAPGRPLCPVTPRTLLLPSVQGEHVHGVGDEQEQAEWRPHLGSLVRAGAPRAARRPGGGAEGAGAAVGAPGASASRGSVRPPGTRGPPRGQQPGRVTALAEQGHCPGGEEPARRGWRVNQLGARERGGRGRGSPGSGCSSSICPAARGLASFPPPALPQSTCTCPPPGTGTQARAGTDALTPGDPYGLLSPLRVCGFLSLPPAPFLCLFLPLALKDHSLAPAFSVFPRPALPRSAPDLAWLFLHPLLLLMVSLSGSLSPPSWASSSPFSLYLPSTPSLPFSPPAEWGVCGAPAAWFSLFLSTLSHSFNRVLSPFWPLTLNVSCAACGDHLL